MGRQDQEPGVAHPHQHHHAEMGRVVVAGERTNEIFIENGRFHGKQIAADLLAKSVSAAAFD